jgi:hypothetical protein
VAEKAQESFARFRSLARKLVAVPKREVDEERAKKGQQQGPKPARG